MSATSPVTAPEVSVTVEPGLSFARRFLANRTATVALALLVALILVAIVAPLVMTPSAQDLGHVLEGPSTSHLLGTDALGRDQLNRLLFASRTSLSAAGIALVVALVLGVPTGTLAGYVGGFVDAAMSRFGDAIMAVPAMLMALALVAAMGTGLTQAMVAIGFIFSPQFFRLSRAATRSLRHETFVEALRAFGISHRVIVLRHVLPNSIAPIAVQAALTAGIAVSAEAGLSFLGLGAQPPTASWGVMLADSFTSIFHGQHLIYPPGFMIMLTVLMLSFVGDGLRGALVPPRQQAEGRSR